MLERSRPVVLQDILERDVPLPVCPLVFIRLTEALAHIEDGHFNIRSILSSDPALTTEVLRVANSAFYGLLRQVRSVSEAVLRLGIHEVWRIAAALKIRQVFSTADGNWSALSASFWDHALTSASISRGLCKAVPQTDSDELFTAALLHDLGKNLLYRVDPQYVLLCQNGALMGRDLVLRETDFFGTNHAKIAGELLRHWNLPDSLVALVAEHHETPRPDDPLLKQHQILALANNMTHALATSGDALVFVKPIPPHLLQSLGLTSDQCLAIARVALRHVVSLTSL